MTKVLSVITFLCLVAAGSGYWIGASRKASGQVHWSSGPTITQLESLTDLVTTKVHISDVLIANDKAYRGSWIIRGDALITVDLTKAKVIESDPTSQTTTIVLPPPRILSPRVDHEKSKTWDIEKVTWIPWKGNSNEMRDAAMLHAQRLVEHAAGFEVNIASSRTTAERVIETFYRSFGWQVTIKWEEAQKSSKG